MMEARSKLYEQPVERVLVNSDERQDTHSANRSLQSVRIGRKKPILVRCVYRLIKGIVMAHTEGTVSSASSEYNRLSRSTVVVYKTHSGCGNQTFVRAGQSPLRHLGSRKELDAWRQPWPSPLKIVCSPVRVLDAAACRWAQAAAANAAVNACACSDAGRACR